MEFLVLRIVILAAMAISLLAEGTHAQTGPACVGPPDGLGEADVIRLVRMCDPRVRAETARAELAESQVVGVGLHPNPQLQWQHQYVPIDGGESQDQLALAVPLAVSGQRAATRALVASNAAVVHAQASLTLSEATEAALQLFYAALHAESERAELARAVARLERGAGTLARRHEAGTASGYDRLRVELELALAASQLRQSEAGAARMRTQLSTQLGLAAAPVQLAGELGPPLGAAPEATERPSSERLAQAAQHARSARGEASDSWLPTVQLKGGMIVADTATTSAGLGYVAGVSLGLPVFQRGQGVRAQAGAAVARADALLAERTRAVALSEGQAAQRLAFARAELLRFDADTSERVSRLAQAVHSGYREGTVSVVELLDVERSQTRTALRRLELMYAARQAEVALRAARGRFE